MDVWESLATELPGRLRALSDLCFWLFIMAWCLVTANIIQYRQRKKADQELAKVHREWREHLIETQAALLAEIHVSAERSETRAATNWTLNAGLRKQKGDAEKLE